MPYANPEIYGAPETWKGNYLFGGLTGDKSREFRCTKPLVPYWEYEAGTTNKASSQLWKGIDVNKITQNEPIDKSVCPVRQGAASPFRSIGVYRKAIIDGVGRDQRSALVKPTEETGGRFGICRDGRLLCVGDIADFGLFVNIRDFPGRIDANGPDRAVDG